MPDDRVRRRPLLGSRRRYLSLMSALVFAVLLVLSGCFTPARSQSPSGTDSSGTSTASARPSDAAAGGGGTGWTVFRATAHQWQVGFSMSQIGSPWKQGTPLVAHLAPGSSPPVYKGKLPVNTLIAPARPPDAVHPAGQFGWRIAPDLGRGELHNGTDIGAPRGSPVVAAMDGVVRAVFWNEWGGKRVEVAHVGGLLTTYNHLDDIHAKKGDALEASQQLGTVGMTGSRVTGPHLHFETWVDDKAVDPQSFNWIDQGRVIRAPREAGQEVQRIPSGGLGDETSLDKAKDCPYPEDHDIECSAPDAVDREERCSTGGDDSDCPDERREVQCPEGGPVTAQCPDAAEVQCPEGGPVTPECPTPSPEQVQCPEGGPVTPECPTPSPTPSLEQVQCPEGGPATPECPTPSPSPSPEQVQCPEGGPVTPECPTVEPPACPPAAPGPVDCEPLGAGPEDCPPTVPGQVDCFPPGQGLEDCAVRGPGVLDCAPAGAGPEDCPAAEGGRTDCPVALPPSEGSSSGNGGDVASQPAGAAAISRGPTAGQPTSPVVFA